LARVVSDRTRGNGFKLKEGKFSLVVRREFFPRGGGVVKSRVRAPYWDFIP